VAKHVLANKRPCNDRNFKMTPSKDNTIEHTILIQHTVTYQFPEPIIHTLIGCDISLEYPQMSGITI